MSLHEIDLLDQIAYLRQETESPHQILFLARALDDLSVDLCYPGSGLLYQMRHAGEAGVAYQLL